VTSGREGIRQYFQGLIDAGVGDAALDTRQVEVSGDLGYGVGAYRLSIRPPAGEPVHDRARYVLVYRRQADGAWRVVVDMFSTDQPVP
jgi:ketosteroid isomerase-like protein